MRIPEPKQTRAGKWYVQLMVDGVRYNRTFDTREDALYWASGLKTKSTQDAKAPRHLTVGEATDKYIESKSSVLSPSTLLGYKKIRKNSMGDIQGVQLQDLTQDRVQRWVNRLSKEKSPKTVQNAHGLLSAVLDTYLPSLKLNTTLPQKVRHEIQIPSKEDLRKILQSCQGTPYELPIMLAVWLGLRQSEILGLRWEDIDGEYLNVRRAIVMGENGQAEKSTKTYSGTRRIHIPGHLKLLLDAQPHTGDHIVKMSGKAVYSGFSRICEKAGVQHYRFHDLRHVNASAMLASGIPSTYSKQRMGHATDHMLKTVYYHTIKEEEVAYDAKIEQYLEDIMPENPENTGSEKVK